MPTDRGPSGADIVRAALARAREDADKSRLERERSSVGRRRSAIRAANLRDRSNSPDSGDPVPFGAAIEGLLAERGWSAAAAVAKVTGDWPGTVGPDLAAHCEPVSLTEGVLTVEAESTAWATQIRLLGPTLLARIAEVAGAGTVRRLVVRGPVGPSWKKGRWSVPGRGPRDTYG